MTTAQAVPVILFDFEQEIMQSDAMKAEYKTIIDLYEATASGSYMQACNVWSQTMLKSAIEKKFSFFSVVEVGAGPGKSNGKISWDHFAIGVRSVVSTGRGISKPFSVFDPLEVTRLGQKNCGEVASLLDRRESREAWKARMDDAFAFSRGLRPKTVPFHAYWSAQDYLWTELPKTCHPL